MAQASGSVRPSSFPKLKGTARQEALAEPGASWREYLFFSFAKAWIILGFAIVDAWIVAEWVQPLNIGLMVLSLAAAFYAEFLAYRYLWYRPGAEESLSGGRFRPSWTRPVRFGRWTPEAWHLRNAPPADDSGAEIAPDPSEFL